MASLEFVSDQVTDVSAVRALPKSCFLSMPGTGQGQSRPRDLSPLKGMQLERLGFGATQLSDISLLKEMPLKSLDCDKTRIASLSPLKGMPIEEGILKAAKRYPIYRRSRKPH